MSTEKSSKPSQPVVRPNIGKIHENSKPSIGKDMTRTNKPSQAPTKKGK